jgi:uncharacterized protein YeeX (DUF496 family)
MPSSRKRKPESDTPKSDAIIKAHPEFSPSELLEAFREMERDYERQIDSLHYEIRQAEIYMDSRE